MVEGNITERSLYPFIIDIIKEFGGSGVSEVLYESQPDIIFEINSINWLLSVKVGNNTNILKSAFLQYSRHKDDSKIDYGMILFVPSEIKNYPTVESEIAKRFRLAKCDVLIDTPFIKEEYGKIDFPNIMRKLIDNVLPRLTPDNITGYPLDTVITLLKQHVQEMMNSISLSDNEIVEIISDKDLLSNIGHTDPKSAGEISKFLASYILLSQVMFLRLYSRYRKDVLPSDRMQGTKTWLRQAIMKVKGINYRPIYSIDVLDAVSDDYTKDTLDLIWGLEIEKVKHELPGRIFHELMPHNVRKLLAAFYTRPQAADLLSKITIKQSDQTVYDPSCGSGTILVSAYKRKSELYRQEGLSGNPHQRFCEQEIYGSDIMPFAVHLTGANLSSLDPSVTLDRLQIILGDSLKLLDATTYKSGVQTSLFPTEKKGFSPAGDEYDVKLEKVDCVLMNPPFTKVERGIRNYVNMKRYGEVNGYEVGLWGHFIWLARDFLKEGGTLGAVIPVNVLRGRESKKVRKLLFEEMTPLYIVKTSMNYGFSEFAEYRDLLLIARKNPPRQGDIVKYILIKKDLKDLDETLTSHFANLITTQDNLLSEEVDIISFKIEDMKSRFDNLMWFFSTNDLKHRNLIENFANKFEGKMDRPPEKFMHEGYRPVPKDVSSFMFLTNDSDSSRTEQAFMTFKDESEDVVFAKTNMGVKLKIEKKSLAKSLRTGVGIGKIEISDLLDYIATRPYLELSRVMDAAGFKTQKWFDSQKFWKNASNEIKRVSTNVAMLRRIGMSSPSQKAIAFYSKIPFSPSNSLNVINLSDPIRSKALVVILNSIIFLSQFYLLKEDSTSRWADIRFYDVAEINLIPKDERTIKGLRDIFYEYSDTEFPSIAEQLDTNFYIRYDLFWKSKRKNVKQDTLDHEEKVCSPSKLRIEFDIKVCKVLGIEVSESQLKEVYWAISEDLIISRGLRRD